MSNNNNITNDYQSQVQKTLAKCASKRKMNENVIQWLYSRNEFEYAYAIEDCATFIGFTNIANVAHVTKANFCRKRLCNICAWRRQSKFLAQTFPVVARLAADGYKFIFATLTVPSVELEELSDTINMLTSAYDKLLKRRKVKKAWAGKIRTLEVTYNNVTGKFHPHIHVMAAVKKNYFYDDSLYITRDELREFWEESTGLMCDYPLQVDIRAVDDNAAATVETLKYTFKMSKDVKAIEGFFRSLRGRRLVSFSGVFAKLRKELRFSDFENVLTDDIDRKLIGRLTYDLYKFDVTGGVYNFYKKFDLEE